jgi:hypothetical protein
MPTVNKIFANNPFENIGQDPNMMGGISNVLSDFGVNFDPSKAAPYLGAASAAYGMISPLAERIRFAREDSPIVDSENPTLSSGAYRRNIANINATKGNTNVGSSAGLGAIKGAAAGAQFGAIGAGIGALAGGITGALGGAKRRRKARRAKKIAQRQFENYTENFNDANRSSQMRRDAEDRYNKLIAGSLF